MNKSDLRVIRRDDMVLRVGEEPDWVKATVWGFILMVCGFFGVLALVAGCIPNAQSPERATARATILVVARALHDADLLCAQYARDTKDVNVAKICADSYDTARPSLLAAEAGVDAWDDISKDRLACATLDSVTALRQISHALEERKIALPAIVQDALALVDGLGKGLCS